MDLNREDLQTRDGRHAKLLEMKYMKRNDFARKEKYRLEKCDGHLRELVHVRDEGGWDRALIQPTFDDVTRTMHQRKL